MRSRRRRALAAVLAVLVLAQFVPVRPDNPPVRGELPAPPELQALLRRACYDCHSNDSRWPWYAYVAPASWLVVGDAREARGEMNFSEWTRWSPAAQAETPAKCWKQVSEGEMPPWLYRLAHPEARLTPADRQVLQAWGRTGPAGEPGSTVPDGGR